MAAVESGLGVVLVTTRASRLVPERVRLRPLSDAPEPLCIVVGHRANRVEDRPLAVFVEELRKAAAATV
jgi:DNA-binding transcriptional LysR family regulator